MHIPDGFLDAKTAAATAVLAATGLAVALRHARLSLPARKVPLLGLSAAFVFAAQMLNFPVAAGTSGHLLGAVLAGVLLGPSAAVIVISAVLIVQCLLFADGGITALGANIFNMALVGGVLGWLVYAILARFSKSAPGRITAAAVAAWVSTMLVSTACAGELAASGTVEWSLASPAMAGVHALIGIGEALITAMVLAALVPIRGDLLGLAPRSSNATPSCEPPQHARGSLGPLVVLGLLVSIGLAMFVAPFACPWPDGLDRAAEVLHLKPRPAEGLAIQPIPDYKMPGVDSGRAATAIAGVAGTIVVFGLAWMLARGLLKRTGGGSLPPQVVHVRLHDGS